MPEEIAVSKMWYTSKQFWTGIVAAVGALLQMKFGWIIPPEYQGYVFTGILFLLRFITKKPLVWTNGTTPP